MRRANSSGSQAEERAAQIALQQGYSIVAKQYLCRYGEIDLVLSHAGTLVFVEVKYRASQAYGGVLHSITHTKQRKLTQAALCFVAEHSQFANHNMRFDAMLFEGGLTNYQWLESAFITD